MVKNADSLYYPIKESILSILPIVDEFVVALGDCDAGDRTAEIIDAIGSPKLKIIRTVWDTAAYPNGAENARQTDIAKSHCAGDWLFYLQADEVVHEKYLEAIAKRCEQLHGDKRIEGLLFKYKHFWGDYEHYVRSHGWYQREIRIIRNDPDIHSWSDAQSFRRIPGFGGKEYHRSENTHKLHVTKVDAEIYHYGWVRPPEMMRKKMRSFEAIYKGERHVNEFYAGRKEYFDYGPMNKLSVFKGAHPAVMKEWISRFDWADKLNYTSSAYPDRKRVVHEIPLYKFVTLLENLFFGGREIGGFQNYKLLRRSA